MNVVDLTCLAGLTTNRQRAVDAAEAQRAKKAAADARAGRKLLQQQVRCDSPLLFYPSLLYPVVSNQSNHHPSLPIHLRTTGPSWPTREKQTELV